MMKLHNVKYTKELLESLVKESKAYSDVIRKLGLKITGSSHSHIKKRILFFGIDTSHFLGSAYNKGKSFPHMRKLASDVLVKNYQNKRDYAKRLRRALIEIGRQLKCEECPVTDNYNGKPITLEIDHKDGDASNNTSENLRFLCPNCHQQTDNYGAKNIKSKKTPILTKTSKEKQIKIPKPRFKMPTRVDLGTINLSHMVKTLTKTEIAKQLNVSRTTVNKYLKKCGITKEILASN